MNSQYLRPTLASIVSTHAKKQMFAKKLAMPGFARRIVIDANNPVEAPLMAGGRTAESGRRVLFYSDNQGKDRPNRWFCAPRQLKERRKNALINV